jgi:hypothetical protein
MAIRYSEYPRTVKRDAQVIDCSFGSRFLENREFSETNGINEAVFEGERARFLQDQRRFPGQQELAKHPQIMNVTLYNSRYSQPGAMVPAIHRIAG